MAQMECCMEGHPRFCNAECLVFLHFALGQEGIKPVTSALDLAWENVGVAAKGDRRCPVSSLRDLVAHHHRGDLGANTRVVEPGRGGVARVLEPDRLDASL
jgi:hypothetical protein